MTSIIYGIVKEEYSICGEERTSYGIAAYSDVENNKTATVVYRVSDVTSNREALEQLVRDCNRSRLPIGALAEIVEDFISTR